jgi:hypothetical protein
MGPDMPREELGGIDHRSSDLARITWVHVESTREEFPNRLISLAALGFRGLAGCVAKRARDGDSDLATIPESSSLAGCPTRIGFRRDPEK